MNVTIHNSRFIGDISFLGNKSITQRVLIASFLASSCEVIENYNDCEDNKAILNFFKAIDNKVVFIDETSLYIIPNHNVHFDEITIDVYNSAAALRFLLPLSLNFASKVTFICGDSLINRPLDIYEQLTKSCNLSIKKDENKIIVSGAISLDYFEIKGNISSQFVTGLMINSIYNKKSTTIRLIPPVESKGYILLTKEVFDSFGFYIKETEENTFTIYNDYIKKEPDLFIEGDYGLASNFIVLSSLNGSLEASNLYEHSFQPDSKIISIIKSMGGNIYFKDNKLLSLNQSLLTKGFAKRLKAIEVDVSECIDLAPIIMVLASFANGKSYIKNVDRLRYKESDRLKAMVDSLKLLNVDISYNNNIISINGKEKYYNNNVIIDSYNDHRIAMALSIFALLNNGSITITNADCVKKSAPLFYHYLSNGIKEGAIEIDNN